MEAKIKAELVFIPSPARGHLLATLEMAKLLVDRDRRLSVAFLVIRPPFDPRSSTHSYSHHPREYTNSRNIRFVDIPQDESCATTDSFHITKFIESHKNHVRAAVAEIVQGSRRKLAGFVVDILCTGMMDVANEFNVPTYVFFTSGAATLALMLHFQGLIDYRNQDPTTAYESGNSNEEILIPSYKFPFPVKSLPRFLLDRKGRQVLMNMTRSLRMAKGIIVNTFLELEFQAMKSLSDDEQVPPIYSVGPILHVDSVDDRALKHPEIMKWLNRQPDSSVVFLCFGSRACFDEVQVKELAIALENSGHRFLWSLRKPPGEYEDSCEALPEGFVQRTAGIGKVIGWAPQVAVLSHRAVGGFVSHCGWNSTLESLWCGVPMAAWALFAEQSANAFQLVNDLGVAVEIHMEDKKRFDGGSATVRADVIENGIRRLIEPGGDIRFKIEALKVKSRMAGTEEGSSFEFIGRFIDDVLAYLR